MNNLNDLDNKINNIEGLKVNLFEHQKTAIYYMSKLEKERLIKINKSKLIDLSKEIDISIETSIGILGDKVGSGKSNMILSLLLLNKSLSNNDTILGTNKSFIVKINNDKIIKTTLLIVPNNILFQWGNFIKQSTLNLLILNDINITNIIKNEINLIEELEKFNLVLLGSSNVKKFINILNKNKFMRIIVDEADTIVLPNNLCLESSFLWLITGTPTGLIYNTKAYLKSILKTDMNWILDYLIIKNNDEYINKSLVLPLPKINRIKCKVPLELKICDGLISDNLINMINAGNTDEAIKSLNFKEDTKQNIFEALGNNILRAKKNKIIELKAESEKEYDDKNEQKKNIEKINNIIKRLEERYETLNKRLKDLEKEYCTICLNEYNNPCLLNCCNNIFCFDCISITINKTNNCPICKRKIDKNNIILINNNKKGEKELKAKNEEFKDILLNNLNGKFLIFSDYYETFNKLITIIKKLNLNYHILKDNEDNTETIINNFTNGSINIIMMNAKYYAAGLNLQIASDIIMYHNFNKEIEEQIIGRAQRIGRLNSLNVHILEY